MIFNCSIPTINAIFQERASARRLCEKKITRLLTWKPNFNFHESNNELAKVEYKTQNGSFFLNRYVALLCFYKVSNNVVKCQIEKNFNFIPFVIFFIFFLWKGYYYYDGGISNALAFLTASLAVFIALLHFWSINNLCKTIKKQYEHNEDFLKLYEYFSNSLDKSIKRTVNEENLFEGSDKSSIPYNFKSANNNNSLEYFIHKGTFKEGPYSFSQLKGKIEKGNLIWRKGMATWDVAENLPELESVFIKSRTGFSTNKNTPPDFNLPTNPPAFNLNS